jgi:hypothetical protein
MRKDIWIVRTAFITEDVKTVLFSVWNTVKKMTKREGKKV